VEINLPGHDKFSFTSEKNLGYRHPSPRSNTYSRLISYLVRRFRRTLTFSGGVSPERWVSGLMEIVDLKRF